MLRILAALSLFVSWTCLSGACLAAPAGGPLDYCALLPNYRLMLENANLPLPQKTENLKRFNTAWQTYLSLRPHRDFAGMSDWCHDTLLQLRSQDGL